MTRAQRYTCAATSQGALAGSQPATMNDVIASEWSSLEVAKLAVGVLTPVLLLVLGVLVSRAARRVEDIQWVNRKLVERRLDLFEEMAPKLNDLFCFFLLVGHFKEIEPPDALRRKRELDRSFHVHTTLFSHDFSDRYSAFMEHASPRSRDRAKTRSYGRSPASIALNARPGTTTGTTSSRSQAQRRFRRLERHITR